MGRRWRVAVLPGDGIGPEVTAEAVALLDLVARTAGVTLAVEQAPVGGSALAATGTPLPSTTLDLCLASDGVLLGAVGGPAWDREPPARRPEAGLLELRAQLGVFANVRPVRLLPALEGVSPLRAERLEGGVDLVIVRELTGGLYFGEPRGRFGDEAVDTMRYRVAEVRRVAEVAFQLAKGRRRQVTSVDKANVLNASALWRETVSDLAQAEPLLEVRHMLVDNAAMQLVLRPGAFDVILTENTFGDILSDLAAALVGSIGLLPSASLGAPGSPGLYEPIHGSAPDIAGRGLANPIGAVLSAALLVEHGFGCPDEARRIEAAVNDALAAGLRTADIAGEGPAVSTQAMGRAIREAYLRRAEAEARKGVGDA
jgi:3-isopropylmalate dehydrogenase